MSVVPRIVRSHPGFAVKPWQFAAWVSLRRRRQSILTITAFAILVALGSVWAVYTMQYFDDLGAAEQPRGNGSLQAWNKVGAMR